MTGAILVINSGSSSLKFAAFADAAGAASAASAAEAAGAPHSAAHAGPRAAPLARLVHGEIEGVGTAPRLLAWDDDGAPLPGRGMAASVDVGRGQEHAFAWLFEWLQQHVPGRALRAVAHRVVHGGEQFTRPVLATPQVLAQLERLSPLAPLHQPHNLSAIRVIAGLRPALPQVACFDTAFHATQAWVMQAYALPQRISRAGVKRYGFHGVSYEYIASALPAHLGAAADGRVVVAHLGNGASLCALRHRKSVATTMGLTALDGLMMGTRCGNLDPGAVLYLMTEMGMTAAEVETLLYEQSGLLGVSGLSADMRTLEASAEPAAQAAIDLYVNRIARELGGVAAALGGLDALVFTAGIGEHSATIRRRVCEDAAWLGVEIDDAANRSHGPCISGARSRVSAWVIPTNEELMLAQHAQALLEQAPLGQAHLEQAANR
jgi:acetate kinase